MNEQHPALVASQASWRCVQAHDKQGWLDLMADDVHIEDPIGAAITNADGGGIRGKDSGCLVDGVEHKDFPAALAA